MLHLGFIKLHLQLFWPIEAISDGSGWLTFLSQYNSGNLEMLIGQYINYSGFLVDNSQSVKHFFEASLSIH